MTTTRTAIFPPSTKNAALAALSTKVRKPVEMVVVIRSHQDDASIELPVAISKSARKVELANEGVAKTENTVESTAKTMRPARRRAA